MEAVMAGQAEAEMAAILGALLVGTTAASRAKRTAAARVGHEEVRVGDGRVAWMVAEMVAEREVVMAAQGVMTAEVRAVLREASMEAQTAASTEVKRVGAMVEAMVAQRVAWLEEQTVKATVALMEAARAAQLGAVRVARKAATMAVTTAAAHWEAPTAE